MLTRLHLVGWPFPVRNIVCGVRCQFSGRVCGYVVDTSRDLITLEGVGQDSKTIDRTGVSGWLIGRPRYGLAAGAVCAVDFLTRFRR